MTPTLQQPTGRDSVCEKKSLNASQVVLANFASEPTCRDTLDFDNNGKAEITESVALLAFLFLGVSPPALPGHLECDIDPHGDEDGLTTNAMKRAPTSRRSQRNWRILHGKLQLEKKLEEFYAEPAEDRIVEETSRAYAGGVWDGSRN